MMKEYPVVVWNEKGKRKAYIPDFDLYVDGLRAAKDAIGSRWLELDEENRTMPEPSDLTSVAEAHPRKKVEMVQVDHEKYVEKAKLEKYMEEFYERLRNPEKYGPSQEEKDTCDTMVKTMLETYYTEANREELKRRIKQKEI